MVVVDPHSCVLIGGLRKNCENWSINMTFFFYRGMTVGVWLLFFLVVFAELVAPLKILLATVFGHHWVAKAVLVSIFFFLFGFFPQSKKLSSASIAWNSTLWSLFLIFLFFIIHYFVG